MNPSAKERIVNLIDAGQGESVWEIGPGLGALTALMLKRGWAVKVFEIDKGFCQLLRDIAFKDEENFTLVEGDALKTLFTQSEEPDIVCGNLPYNVGSPCIARLVEKQILAKRMVFTLQKEVVERIVARPDSEAYSAFSIITQLDYVNRLAFNIGRSSFYPSPNVDSSVVLMERREKSLVEDEIRSLFIDTVHLLFSQKRKTIRNNFKAKYGPRTEAILEASGFGGMERAEELTVEDFKKLCRAIEETA